MLPEYQRKLAEQEAEIQRDLEHLSRDEQARLAENYWLDGDYMGLEDGRPGLEPGDFGENLAGAKFQVLIWAGVLLFLLVVLVAGQVLKGSRLDPDARPAGASAATDPLAVP